MYKTNYLTISIPKNDRHPMLQTKSIQETYRDPKEKQISHLSDLCKQLISECHHIIEPIYIQLNARNHVMTNTDHGYRRHACDWYDNDIPAGKRQYPM